MQIQAAHAAKLRKYHHSTHAGCSASLRVMERPDDEG
jgi:hypothetical protein